MLSRGTLGDSCCHVVPWETVPWETVPWETLAVTWYPGRLLLLRGTLGDSCCHVVPWETPAVTWYPGRLLLSCGTLGDSCCHVVDQFPKSPHTLKSQVGYRRQRGIFYLTDRIRPSKLTLLGLPLARPPPRRVEH